MIDTSIGMSIVLEDLFFFNLLFLKTQSFFFFSFFEKTFKDTIIQLF